MSETRIAARGVVRSTCTLSASRCSRNSGRRQAAVSIAASLFSVLMTAGCTSVPSGTETIAPVVEPVPEIRPGILAGYLGKELTDSLLLLPPPPDKNSAAFKHDQAVSRASQKFGDTPRYALAVSDADLSFPHAASAFTCALDMPITQEETPRLYLLLRRTLTDAGLATYGAKNQYNHIRPFVYFKQSTCTPDDEAELRKDGSYPSGHTSIGWAWALLLTELAPQRSDALLARGRSFGESRLICNAHWQSDVLEGRFIGAATVARLHADETFNADMRAARIELDALRLKDSKPQGDCAAEAAALATGIPDVL